METVKIGKTGMVAQKNGFGALPIQRISKLEAIQLLQRAFAGGINYYDTARAYSDSEEKLGAAFHTRRHKVYIATKTMAKTPEGFWKDLATSLKTLQTDYVDLYQFHNPPVCFLPGDGSGMYEAMQEAVRQGKVRHIGITNHRLPVANAAIDSGLYETLQFPFSYLASPADYALVEKCKQAGMGFFAMKSLAGGLLTNSRAAYAFAGQYDHVLPLWGVQRESELDEFLSYIAAPPVMDQAIQSIIDKDIKELSGEFCRGCGYCMPTCPVHIEINNCARMSLLLRRSPTASHLTKETQAKMEKITECIHCNQCKDHCPYGLDTPALLEKNLADYRQVLAKGHV
jgi:aryl-alcohol dehydrogenase-like predicted oxidoreductase/Pyruvate/2-oxoacid:ferredoxin oxidoreductase delta subunit